MRPTTPRLALSTLALSTLALAVALLPACGQDLAEGPDPLALSAAPLAEETLPVETIIEPPPVVGEAPLPLLAPLAAGASSDERLGPAFAETLDIVVRHGETLVVLADQAACTAEDLAALNGFDVTTTLRAGQRILVPVDRVDGDTLQGRRDDSLARRLDRYLRGRGGIAGVSTHRVRTGETGWSIARDVVDVPLWVLAAYNPEVDLDRLGIGDSLQVPVLTDMVAELEPALLEVATELPGEREEIAPETLDLDELARELEAEAALP